ncbi:MAG: hypothetical protein KatS3mg008_0196 [Acidimicrobiales bacterium]|nr:MAG: hypothetical protein KatS3mg008_0196 [Acidimicrobiales bacterium]
MVSREQQHARLLARAMSGNGRPGADLAWIVVAFVLVFTALFASGVTEEIDARLVDIAGEGRLGLVAVVLLLTSVGSVVFAVRRYRDNAVVREALERMAEHDPLTGLPNREFLGEPFGSMLDEARRTGARVAVMMIDLNGFKKINDTYGHDVGDQIMVALADRLVEAAGPNDKIVRYGGDEFVALCPDVTNVPAAERLAKRFLRVIETPFEWGDELLHVSATIGIAIAEERCNKPEDVLRDADAALFQAKSRGAGSWAVYDRSMKDVLTPSNAERRLREALENGEFKLYYQPIVSLWTKRLIGVEALLRWEDGGRGVVRPEEFVPALEDTGLIVPVGNWVLSEVCRQTREWQDKFPDRPAINVKVNVSARQLAQSDFSTTLRHALETSGADPDRICLEITEGALSHDITSAWAVLREAKAMGLTLALDDFGTGFSSLSYLRRFSIDLLKIDRIFVEGLGKSKEDETIVEHIIGMAKALNIVTVAEGVETEEQVEHLRALNCDLAQGYYFSPPQPPHVIDRLLEQGTGQDEWRPILTTEEDTEDTAAVVEIPRFRRVQIRPSQ